MSASIGPKLFHIDRKTLEHMMQVNYESLCQCVEQVKVEVERAEEKNTKASLQRWQRKFEIDRDETRIMLQHLRPDQEVVLTGTELIGIYRTFREVAIEPRYLYLLPPPGDGEFAERRLANTAAAIPRNHIPEALAKQ